MTENEEFFWFFGKFQIFIIKKMTIVSHNSSPMNSAEQSSREIWK